MQNVGYITNLCSLSALIHKRGDERLSSKKMQVLPHLKGFAFFFYPINNTFKYLVKNVLNSCEKYRMLMSTHPC